MSWSAGELDADSDDRCKIQKTKTDPGPQFGMLSRDGTYRLGIALDDLEILGPHLVREMRRNDATPCDTMRAE